VQQERGNNERQRTRKQNLKTWRTRPDWRFTKPYDLSYDYLKFSVRSTYDSDLKRANKDARVNVSTNVLPVILRESRRVTIRYEMLF